jgi:hypothetical protein
VYKGSPLKPVFFILIGLPGHTCRRYWPYDFLKIILSESKKEALLKKAGLSNQKPLTIKPYPMKGLRWEFFFIFFVINLTLLNILR